MADNAGAPSVLGVMCSEPPSRNKSYPIEGDGLYIIITHNDFKYNYTNKKLGDKRCKELFQKPFNSMKSKENELKKELMQSFQLRDGDVNLYPEGHIPLSEKKGDNEFGTFIRKIEKHMTSKQLNPRFVVLVMATAGLKSGEFLLENAQRENCVDPECRKGNHTLTNRCYGRRVSDLVRAFQEAETAKGGWRLFTNIPIIFVIQTVSGIKGGVKPKSGGEPTPPSLDPNNYIPTGSDTFVLFAHTEQDVSWVNTHGFYLIKEFCRAVSEIKESTIGCNRLLRELSEIWAIGDTALTKSGVKSSQSQLQIGSGDNLDSGNASNKLCNGTSSQLPKKEENGTSHQTQTDVNGNGLSTPNAPSKSVSLEHKIEKFSNANGNEGTMPQPAAVPSTLNGPNLRDPPDNKTDTPTTGPRPPTQITNSKPKPEPSKNRLVQEIPLLDQPAEGGEQIEDERAEVDNATLEKVNKYLSKELGLELELDSPSLTDSLLDNMCTSVMANVSKFLKTRNENESMRAHISSTLRFKLCVTDLLLHSQPVKPL